VVPQPPELSGARILVVDDEPVNARLVMAMLRAEGHAVTVATDGAQAVDLAAVDDEGAPFDAIIMDVQMPVMDGLEATRLIRRDEGAGAGAGVPVIALTAFASREAVHDCLDAGMSDFLTKPVDRATLKAVLHRRGIAGAGAVARPWDVEILTQPDHDPSRLREIETLVDPAAFAEILAAGRLAVADDLSALAAGTDAPDALHRRLHKLVSLAGNFGLLHLRERARSLDNRVRRNQPARPGEVASLVAAIDRSLRILGVPVGKPEP